MNRRQTASGDHRDRAEIGTVHMRGMDAHDHETFCGYHWSGNMYEDTEDPVTCPGCLRAANEARALLKARPVRAPTKRKRAP